MCPQNPLQSCWWTWVALAVWSCCSLTLTLIRTGAPITSGQTRRLIWMLKQTALHILYKTNSSGIIIIHHMGSVFAAVYCSVYTVSHHDVLCVFRQGLLHLLEICERPILIMLDGQCKRMRPEIKQLLSEHQHCLTILTWRHNSVVRYCICTVTYVQ